MPAPLPSSVATLTASRLSRELGGNTVLRDVSLTIAPDTRLGVVGPNGVGKSTLLRILAGLEQPDAGRVELTPATATVGYLAQETERHERVTVRAHLHRATGVARADEELQRSAEALGRGEDAADAYADALERWQSLGAADLDARIEAVLATVELPDRVVDLPTAALSGGQLARVALAAVLLSRFDVTLLDEPTNDLDFAGLDQLERFVAGRPGAVVVVSHDRAFLENTVTSVLELDEHERSARLYRGGWRAFLEERSTARRHAEEAYADYQSRRGTLLDRARRERRWATSGAAKEKRRPRDHDTAQRDFRLNRTEQLAARARRTEQALARLEPVDKPWQGWDLRFAIHEAPRAGSVVARLEAAVVQRGDFRLGPLDLEIGWGERWALAGANGAGKTTLIEALLGRIPLESGRRYLGPGVEVGELGQQRSAFTATATLLDAFVADTGLDAGSARTLLAKFGIGTEHVRRPAASLSPGERTRTQLAAFQARGINFLVLDEPTNHLDLPAVEQLEEALAGYGGTLLVVTHDRQFIAAVDVDHVLNVGGTEPHGATAPLQASATEDTTW